MPSGTLDGLRPRAVRLLACVAILHFVLLAYSPPDYSPGNLLERRDHHLDLKLPFLQCWDLLGRVKLPFSCFQIPTRPLEASG